MPLLVPIRFHLILAAFLFLTSAAALCAETSASVLVTLRVTDTTDSPLQNARVQITPTSGPVSKPLVTNNKGEVILHLESGAYEVQVSRNGFQGLKQHINVESSKAALIHLRLVVPFFGSGSPVVKSVLPLHTTSVPLHQLVPDVSH